MSLDLGSPRPGFTGATLDRADRLRQDAEALAAAAGDWRARLLALKGLDPVIGDDGRLRWVSLAEAGDEDELILLGLEDGRARFAALSPRLPPMDLRNRAVWAALDELPPDQAALYAAARSLLDWHARHPFCARCGARSRLFRAGWGRKCANCATEHFPRTDPVVIMLAEHDGRALVGRQPSWPAGRYSALAGFVEPGEAIEEAVARELHEEAGVIATSVRYLTSQPWPFPSQLMIAAVAPVESDALTVDGSELEDAKWVTRDEVRDALAGKPGAAFLAPPRMAIAHTLLARWANS